MAEPNLAVDRRRSALEAIFRDAEARLSMLVAASLTRGNLGTARYRANQLRQVRGILGEMLGRAVPEATQLVAQGYVHGGQVVDTVLATPRFASSFSGVHQEAVDMLADNLAAALGEATRTVGRRVEDVFRRQGLAAIAQGLATGASRREVSDDLIDLLTRQGVTGFTDKAGRNWGLATYAEMVARTTTREAVSLGTTNRMLEHGEDRVRISSHPHDKDVCSPYDGKVFSLTGRNGDPKLDRLPPFHPNCRHVVAPAKADLDQVIAELESAQSWEAAEAALGVGAVEGEPPPLSVEAGGSPAPPPAQPESLTRAIDDAARAALKAEIQANEDAERAGKGDTVEASDMMQPGQRSTPELREAVNDATTAIEGVHALPRDKPNTGKPMPALDDVRTNNTMRASGAYALTLGHREIRVRTRIFGDKARLDRMNIVLHEFGHYLDEALFGKSYAFATDKRDPVVEDVRQAIIASETIKRLEAGEVKMSASYRKYLLGFDESFARAYNEWIAVRSGNEQLLARLEDEAPYLRQWPRAEFEPIAEAFDRLFAAWRRQR